MFYKFKIFLIVIFFSPIAYSQDINEWFTQESQGFLNLMKNENNNTARFGLYLDFVKKNFAIKSIAYGLLNEKVINSNDDEKLNLYVQVFENYLTNTIYNLSDPDYNGEIQLIGIESKDSIYLIDSEIVDKDSRVKLYWKVATLNDSFKILDVIVENTSYFVTKKSEFSKILRKNKNNLDLLILEIETK
jgi:ABC-type transporter MlaC component